MSERRRAYFLGLREGAPFVLVVGPFGLLFGVVGTEAGLNIAEVMGFSVLVIAGASQFTALSLLGENAPVLIVLATSLAVNLRMAMYSAALVPHFGEAPLWKRALAAYLLVDQTYACSVARYEREPDWGWPERFAYYLGAASPVVPIWYVLTLTGALAGAAIPEALALDFAVPICFLAMVAPMLRTVPHVLAAVVSVVVALLARDLPWGLGLILAGLVAMAVGAEAERRLTRPKEDW